MNKRLLIFCFLLNFFCLYINAQSNNAFNENEHNYYQEKIYVHSNKDFYLAGDIIWFKIYNVSADSLKISALSKIAYIELLSAENIPVFQAKINIKNGCGNGSFFIPTTVKSGNYILRAYTNWMKNFDEDLFFHKNISIVNTLKPIGNFLIDTTKKLFVDFMPEGGNLINGIESEVGFKITDQNGKGIIANADIIDEQNKKIVSFSTYKYGMATFKFKPEPGKKYTALISANGVNISQEIPLALSSGYVIHINDDDANISVLVKNNYATQLPVSLMVYNQQKICYSAQQTINSNSAEFAIPKQKLPLGISHIILFNENKQPVCERLYFKKPKADTLIISSDKEIYATRSPVQINILSKATSHLSLSVFLNDSLQTKSTGNINTYYWLTSFLKGYIEAADSYLNDTSQKESVQLKNLLITQGWSRFINSNQHTNPEIKFIPEHEGQLIAGKITDKQTGKPLSNKTIFLTIPGKNYKLASCKSDENGNVYFDIKDFFGPAELIVQPVEKDSNIEISIANPFLQTVRYNNEKNKSVSFENIQLLKPYNIYVQAQNAYNNNAINTFKQPAIDSFPFYGKADATYLLDNYKRFNTMEEDLREYVYTVGVRKKDNNYSLTVVDNRNFSMFRDNMLVLIDGVPEADINKLITYDPLKIKKIEVITRQYYLNNLTANGIISLSTYNGDLDGYKFESNTIEFPYDGLQIEREFYSPHYQTEADQNSRKPDFRTALYWQPDINADKNNPSVHSFYTSDLTGKFTAVVEGIDDDGNVINASTDFMVK